MKLDEARFGLQLTKLLKMAFELLDNCVGDNARRFDVNVGRVSQVKDTRNPNQIDAAIESVPRDSLLVVLSDSASLEPTLDGVGRERLRIAAKVLGNLSDTIQQVTEGKEWGVDFQAAAGLGAQNRIHQHSLLTSHLKPLP
jgi:hypothetical protein